MIAHFRTHNDRFSCRVTSKLTNQLDWPSWNGTPTDVAPVAEVVAVPERDTVSRVMTAPARLKAVVASLTTGTKEKVGSQHVETLVKEPPSEQVIEENVFPSNTPPLRHHISDCDLSGSVHGLGGIPQLTA